MAINAEDYEPVLKYGGQILINDLAVGSVTGSQIAAGVITGSMTTLGFNFGTFVVGTTGPTKVNLFPTGATAPVAVTITGMVASNASTVAASTVLWATTAGTIATIVHSGSSAFFGFTMGTTPFTATIAAGDTAFIQAASAGTTVAFVTFQTIN